MKNKFLVLIAALTFAIMFTFAGCAPRGNTGGGGNGAGEGETGTTDYIVKDGQAYTDNDIVYDKNFWQTPEVYDFADVAGKADDLSERGIKALFFRGADYKGAQTRVFAYLGLPSGASASNKAPGVVLVHGGGGTAYKEWVSAWTERGFAALAVDYQGNMPLAGCPIDGNKYTAIPGFTAPKNTFFADADQKTEDQWMYWATSAAILANSLLRAQPEVDADKVGIAGISWGSVITTITIGYDNRFAFACPIYGGLYNSQSGTYFDKFFTDNPKALMWDDIEPIKACIVPTHFTMWSKDNNFSVSAVSRTVEEHPTASFSIRESWYHSHGGGLGATEAYAFAQAVCKTGRPLIGVKIDDGELKTEIPSGASVDRAELFVTLDTVVNGDTEWSKIDLGTNTYIPSLLPAGAEYYYVSVTDERGRISTTPMQKA